MDKAQDQVSRFCKLVRMHEVVIRNRTSFDLYGITEYVLDEKALRRRYDGFAGVMAARTFDEVRREMDYRLEAYNREAA